MDNEKLDLWAIVELFGHQKMAGKVTEQSIGSSSFVRVHVPDTGDQPAFDRLLNPSAIYAINPVTEEVAKAKAHQLKAAPIEAWDYQRMHQKMLELNEARELEENEL